MDQTVTDRIEERVKSAFPAGAIERVQVLEYGDDPEVEPGETAVRAFISRAGVRRHSGCPSWRRSR
jgi:hypothetical protein